MPSKTYNFLSYFYNFIYGPSLQNGRNKLSLYLENEVNKKILEIGVGTGLTLNHYPKSCTVIGVDVSDKMLKKAKDKVRIYCLNNVTLLQSDGEHLEFSDDHFDHVVLAYVYSVSPNPEILLKEAFRVCKKGGHVWILNHFSGNGQWSLLEYVVSPVSKFLGFRSIFPYQKYVVEKNMKIEFAEKVNLFNLSLLIKTLK
jgi:phosphatidylethanolamine/phosphatidyl-N-methylethanolamine N-methyltransferase